MKLETVSKCSNLKDNTGAGALEGEMGRGERSPAYLALYMNGENTKMKAC